MLYMVIETFRPGMRERVYTRFKEHGRLLPDGLTYRSSWVELEGDRCFQLMESADPRTLDEWIANWTDLVEFEIVPVELSPTATTLS